MIFLIDHNLKGHALVLLGAIASQGWLDVVSIQFVTFVEMELPILNREGTPANLRCGGEGNRGQGFCYASGDCCFST